MKVISNDSYFILGLQSLYEEGKFINLSDKIVLDAGGGSVYILHGEKLSYTQMNDPLSAMLYCRYAFFPRNANIDEYNRRLYSSKFSIGANIHLTSREEVVIMELCKMADPKELARKLDISIKTISCYKQKALSKLGLKNIISLRTVLQSWREVLPDLLVNYRR